MSKLSKPDYEQYVQLREQYLMWYRVTVRIQTFSDLVRSSLKDRYPGIPGSEVKAVLDHLDPKTMGPQRNRKIYDYVTSVQLDIPQPWY